MEVFPTTDPMAGVPHSLRGRVLVGADGNRWEDDVRQLRGQRWPEPFVNFIGSRSLLDSIFDRAAPMILRQRMLIIGSKHHLSLPEIQRRLSGRMAQ